MKAGWVFIQNDNGTPKLPAGVGGSLTTHLDIYRATGGPAGFEHTHLLIGAYGLPSAQRVGQVGADHYHWFPYYNGQYRPLTIGTTAHTHDATISGGVIQPDYFLIFWMGSDADAAAINADPTCLIAAQTIQEENEEGQMVFGALDDTAWTGAERTQWEVRIANVLGLALPVEVTNGSRLIAFFIGFLLGRANQDEMNLRGLPLVVE